MLAAPECGHKLAGPAECRSCGQAVPAGAKFCPECGTAT
ncbi:MAG TPA: zinc-ribbon domain-containing protein [Actinocrinis sp.]|nr:zinc-ribbon domain-containing protein [Actinocrinis sp.]HZU57262.1 zinc-ribbon domain-containing protein [Actinocrinis sp.]